MRCTFYLLAFLAAAPVTGLTQKPGEEHNFVVIDSTDSEAAIIRKAATLKPSPRQLRWQQLELTAFFHFGINTFTNREWGTGKEDPKLFLPSSLDADQWVREAKAAGIKQVILTAKHHDGFCLWPTETTAHSVQNSPWKGGKGDVVEEVAEACRKHKIGFGIYLSPWDMNAAVYGTEAYNDFYVRQLTELLTRYDRIDEVWFDGANGEGPNGKKQVYDFERWYGVIRTLQPHAIIAVMGPDVRWVGTETGYGRETEWSVVPADNLNVAAIGANSQQAIAFKPQGDMMGNDLGSRDKLRKAKGLAWYPAETDVSIRPGWFYHAAEDNKVKSPAKLFDIYFNSVGRNGVLLLNIPPDKRGLIHESDIKALVGWKRLVDETFDVNLLKGAAIKSANGIQAARLLDSNLGTHFTTKGNDTTTVLEFTLPRARTFDVLQLKENINIGQRVERFALEVENGGHWKEMARGTTIGFKRLMRFAPLTARKLRLLIKSSRLNPAIAEICIYLQPPLPKE